MGDVLQVQLRHGSVDRTKDDDTGENRGWRASGVTGPGGNEEAALRSNISDPVHASSKTVARKALGRKGVDGIRCLDSDCRSNRGTACFGVRAALSNTNRGIRYDSLRRKLSFRVDGVRSMAYALPDTILGIPVSSLAGDYLLRLLSKEDACPSNALLPEGDLPELQAAFYAQLNNKT